MKIEDVAIIVDYEGNQFFHIDTDTKYEERTTLVGFFKPKKINGETYIISKGAEVSLKKEDRRTINGVMFAKIVEL